MPDFTSEKFKAFREHESDVYQQIDALTDGGNAAAAMEMCRKLLSEQDGYLGKDNCESLNTYKRIVNCASRMNDGKTQLDGLQKILELKARFLGADCIDTALALGLVNDFLIHSRHVPEAVFLVHKYSNQANKHDPSDACKVGYLYVEAQALESQGKYAQSCDKLDEALMLKTRIPALSMVAPKPFALLLVAARAAREAGQLDRAYDYAVRAEALRFGIGQMEDSQFINELLLMAEVSNKKGNRESAEKSLRLAMKFTLSNRSLEPYFLKQTWTALHYQLTADGKSAEASKLDASVSSALRNASVESH
jgi:tetratricopeptide (TPR) repeat protein